MTPPQTTRRLFTLSLAAAAALASSAAFAQAKPLQGQVVKIVRIDPLSGLLNRRGFIRRSEAAIARSASSRGEVALMMLDLDHFKQINDLHGHALGDQTLSQVAQLLFKAMRRTDIVARYGGEEFVIILPETTLSDAKIVAERIRRDIDRCEFPSLTPGQPPLRVTISIGVASFPLNADSKDDLIAKADSMMYRAKGRGRNQVILCGVGEG